MYEDDLISRKAAIEALGEEPLRWNNTIAEGHEWNDWKYHVNAIKSVPTVPAVPLDKLCEWLGGHGMLAPCYFDQKCDHCNLSPYWRREKSECWRHVLTEWMEGLDGTD